MKAIRAALLIFLPLVASVISGCGGAVAQQATGEMRKDLLFGYYGGCSTTVLENGDHVNTHWATGWCGTGTWHLDVAQELALARGAGIRNIVLALPHGLVWAPGAEAEVRFQLVRLQQAGALDGWDSIMVYPQDEPDIDANGPKSDAEVTKMLGWLRRVLAGFPSLKRAPVGVIYSCSSGRRPGMASFDWIGCDDYNAGCAVTAQSGAYDDLLAAMKPEQRLIVVPGGADPWKQDPTCFEDYANRTPRVVMIAPFIWQDHAAKDVGAGVRSNGLRKFYCEVGRMVRYGDGAGCL